MNTVSLSKAMVREKHPSINVLYSDRQTLLQQFNYSITVDHDPSVVGTANVTDIHIWWI